MSSSETSVKVAWLSRQSIKVGMSGSTAVPVVATIRLNEWRACVAQTDQRSPRSAPDRSAHGAPNDDEPAHRLGANEDSPGRLLVDVDPVARRSRRPRREVRESLGDAADGHDEVVGLVDGGEVLGAGRRRARVELDAGEQRGEDGAEKGDLLLGDLVEDRDERADGLEEVQLGVEERGRSGRFGEDRFRRGLV